MAFGKPKGIGVMIAVGKPKGDDLDGPEPPDKEPDPMDKNEANEDESGGGVTFDELGFHDGSEICQNCKFYDPSGEMCNRVGEKIPSSTPANSWCHAFAPGNEGSPEMGGEQQMGMGDQGRNYGAMASMGQNDRG